MILSTVSKISIKIDSFNIAFQSNYAHGCKSYFKRSARPAKTEKMPPLKTKPRLLKPTDAVLLFFINNYSFLPKRKNFLSGYQTIGSPLFKVTDEYIDIRAAPQLVSSGSSRINSLPLS